MWCGIVTLFPEMFQALSCGIISRALKNRLLEVDFYNPRDFTTDPHKTVDDRPYGGGPGMVMKVEPLFAAIEAAALCFADKQKAAMEAAALYNDNAGKQKAANKVKIICMSPQGKRITQKDIDTVVAESQDIIFVAGRYEGIDERVYDMAIDQEWSIGDYVLSGGELAIMVVLDAIARLLPGALGHECSAKQDSFVGGLLDCPHYTRPEVVHGHKVPDVLLSGDHQAISNWRLQQQLGRTWLRRPDLLAEKQLTNVEKKLLESFIEARGSKL
jgi:tRNA (guanine37-N1)-methyltransferase